MNENNYEDEDLIEDEEEYLNLMENCLKTLCDALSYLESQEEKK